MGIQENVFKKKTRGSLSRVQHASCPITAEIGSRKRKGRMEGSEVQSETVWERRAEDEKENADRDNRSKKEL